MTTKFTTDHEWINIEDHDAAVVGITLHAQDALGDVVFVDLPAVGRTFAKGEIAGVVESVKAAADIYMPVSGEVVEVNEKLRDEPALANTDPLGEGWFFKVKISNMAEFDELMDGAGYDALLKTLCPLSAPPAPRAARIAPRRLRLSGRVDPTRAARPVLLTHCLEPRHV